MTIKTKVLGLLQFAQGDDERAYLEKWLALSLRQTDAQFDPVSGHNHSGAGSNGPVVAGGVGVPTGGTTGQVLAKNSNANYDTAWVAPGTAIWGAP